MSKNKSTLAAPTISDNLEHVIHALEDVEKTDLVSSSEYFLNDFKSVIERLRDHAFKMAVVGEFSSGKSTFLNALIGADILKHGAKETTATITEIKNDLSKTDDTSFDVYYENGEIETNLPVSQLMEYTATASVTHAVAHEISKVVIRSKVIEADYPVSFIDTPGLNGVADLHREKTIAQIKNSHACIYLLPVRGLGNSDIEFLKFITQYQKNIIFIQNFIDELKELEGETPEEKIEKQKDLIEEHIRCQEKDFTYKIFPISARQALIARDRNIREYDGIEMSDSYRKSLYEESRFGQVIKEITNLMGDNNRKSMQQNATISVALHLLDQLYEIVSFQNNREKVTWANSLEAHKIQGYEQILQTLKDDKKVYHQNLLNFIETESGNVRKSIQTKIDRYLQETEITVREKLDSFSTEEEIKVYLEKEHMPQYLYGRISECERICNQELGVQFENLITSAILRIEEYTGYKTDILVPEMECDISEHAGNYLDFEETEDDIHQMEEELERQKADLKADKVKLAQKNLRLIMLKKNWSS